MKVTEIPKRERGKSKVCAYVRVSRNSEEQEESFLFQSRYWERKFISDGTVEYVGLFSDNGVSGKSMRNRKGLNKMLEFARNGGVDRIYTKSVSRFARNYAEAITIIRELRDISIPIIFEKENINTLDPKCELILSVMASLAEEELRSMSENQKWAVRKRFAEGKPDCSRTYGYRVVNNHLEIDQTEAIGVRRIYELYLQGFGATKIAQILDNEGIKTLKGGAWSSMSVRGILFNEVYIGDHLLQKNVYNMKSRHKNDGELPQYYVQDTHKPIIDRQTFERVQEIHIQRKLKYDCKCTGDKHPLAGKIRCGYCGASYKKQLYAKGKTYECVRWICYTKNTKGKSTCANSEIKHDVFIKLLLEAYNECCDAEKTCGSLANVERELERLLETEMEIKRLHAKGYLSAQLYQQQKDGLLKEIRIKEDELKTLKLNSVNKLKLRKSAVYEDYVADFLMQAVVENYTVKFIFENGYETIKVYTNGRSGNVNGKLRKQNA
ncbi:MAG: recombinase family protein [Roseburia sp.]|nr:recombinase family protein [Roseburia sp.]